MLILLLACATKTPVPTSSAEAEPAPAENAPDATEPVPKETAATLAWNGEAWTVALTPPPGDIFLFETQHGPYRSESWSIEGGRIEPHGFDVLIREAETVHITITPPDEAPPHLPILSYADGSSLFGTSQLALATVADLETAVALEGRWRNWSGTQLPSIVTLPSGEQAQVHHGAGPYVHSETGLGSSLDPGLPDWIAGSFPEDWTRVEAALLERFSDALPPAVTHLAHAGEGEGWNNTGFAIPTTIAMSIQTSSDPADNEEHLAAIRWFFAHERVHHHQLSAGVGVRGWPLEGGADTFASATMVQLGWADDAWLVEHYESVRADCAAELVRGPVRNAPGRVQYVCGDLLNLATWSATGDLVTFWESLLGEAKGQGARVDGSFFVYVLGKHVEPEVALAFEHFETARHDDPDAAIEALLEASGVRKRGQWALGFVE